MKKSRLAMVLVSLLILISGCAGVEREQGQSETLYEKNYPLPPGKTAEDVLNVLTGGNTYYSDHPILENIIKKSDVIVLAKVVKQEKSYMSNATAFVATAYQIEVEKVFKGDVEEKAKLSVSTDGGFLSVREFVEFSKEDTRRIRELSELPEAEKEKLIGYFSGEYRTIERGKSYVFFLGPVLYDKELFSGDYRVLYGGYGIYSYDEEKEAIHNPIQEGEWFDLKELIQP